MKINLEIDCTPEEARRFLGLPDLEPLQAAVMGRLQQQMLDAVTALSPEALLRQWAPLTPQTPERLREAMAAMMGAFVPPQGGAQGGAQGGGSGGGSGGSPGGGSGGPPRGRPKPE